MKEGIAFAHERGVKVYVTANILAHNEDLPGVEAYFEELKEVKPDALIISDPGIFAIARRILPDMELHVSTQANNTNYGTYLFWHQLGAKRVVSARELSLEEIREIRAATPTRAPARIPAGGSILLWRRQDQENICLSMKTSVEPTFSIPRICA